MIGYVYKTINKITGEFYIGKRESRLDLKERSIYLGSGVNIKENIKRYGKDNFEKIIIAEFDNYDDMTTFETEVILKNLSNPLCLNSENGCGYGGIYITGTCPECNKENVVLYSKSGLCMNCILGEQTKEYCPECERVTFRYKSGKCMACVAKKLHSTKWCEFCQRETTHFSDICKHHKLYLVKNNDKIELHIRNAHHGDKIVTNDVETFLKTVNKIETPKSVVFEIPNEIKMLTEHKKEKVHIDQLIYNKDISDWLKISYKYDNRYDHVRSFVCTTDHPLPEWNDETKQAKDFKIGEKLTRIEQQIRQLPYAEIIKIEKIEQTCRSYDIATSSDYFDMNNDIVSHNCRSFLSPDPGLPNIAKAKNYDPDKHKYYGRLNQGVVTINLPDVALSSNKDINKFWQILEERLELCHKALRCRHERLLGTPSDMAPILWQNGALARLEKGEVIDPLLFGDYSTISLGYAGIYEMTKYMTGESHTSEKGREFAISVMQKLNDKCNEWKNAENIGYSVYSTPLESVTYKFAKSLRNRFGTIESITDRNYITNSYHVHVTEKIDAFSKLSFEAPFQKLALGGCISYAEIPNMKNNIEAIISLLQHIYNTTMYAELNTKSDYCQCCGFDGEIQIIEDDGKLVWECPNCGNRDQNKLNVCRRTCGERK